MARVVTASEVDRLHETVASLQRQVNELSQRVFALEQSPNLTPAKPDEFEPLYDYNAADVSTGGVVASPPVESSEDLEVVDSQETRIDADAVVDEVAGD